MMNVSALFGENAAPDKRCGEGIVNILKAAVEEIYTGGLAKVTLNLRGGGQSINFTECKGWNQRRAYRDKETETHRVMTGGWTDGSRIQDVYKRQMVMSAYAEGKAAGKAEERRRWEQKEAVAAV